MTTQPVTTESLNLLDGRLQEHAPADGRRLWKSPDGDAVALSMVAGGAMDPAGTNDATVRVVSTDWIRAVVATWPTRLDGDTEVSAGRLSVPFDGVTFQFDVTCCGRQTSWGAPLPSPSERLGVLLDVVAAAVRPSPELAGPGQPSLPGPHHYVPAPHGVVRALNDEAGFSLLRRLVGTELHTLLTPGIHVFAPTGSLELTVAAITTGERSLLIHARPMTGGLRNATLDFVSVVDTDSTLPGYVSSIRVALQPAAVERVQLYQRHVLSWARDEEFVWDAVLMVWRTDGTAVRFRSLDSGLLAVQVSSPGVAPSSPRHALRWDSSREVRA
jgi:hypothetical protein